MVLRRIKKIAPDGFEPSSPGFPPPVLAAGDDKNPLGFLCPEPDIHSRFRLWPLDYGANASHAFYPFMYLI